ncbi:peptidase C39 family protein [Nocardioides sp. KR10-350]|uniref:peptidase C39 family protein n=1 Tax=Nocardioides cheoyonin TaxID=3156615 RepID=UPI0032B4C119
MLRKLAASAALVLALPLAGGAMSVAAEAAPAPAYDTHVTYHQWKGTPGFKHGTSDGTVVDHGALRIARPVGTLDYTDPFGDGSAVTYDYATWLSPTVSTAFGLTELVSSWNATTPAGTWIQVEVSGTTETGAQTKWYVLGRWASYDEGFHRTSVDGQKDDDGTVYTDTFATRNDHTLEDYRLRLTLYRKAGTTATPKVTMLGAMASAVPDDTPTDTPLGGAEGIVLDVPTYSQEIHKGQYPQYDNGGEAWCSPTSTAMVLDYWGAGPTPEETSWVDPSYADPQVDHAARSVFDYTYDGAGNWPFNAAYAGSRGLEGFVTRLRSLTEAEQFIKKGIPLVTSLSFEKGELDGAGYGTNGHLMVLVGFDADGNPVMNDPASHLIASDDQVRVTYDRAQFEQAWSHSGRIVYVIHPASVKLPKPPKGEANW